jgi:site-specific DNA-methyltransferase (adenine-specific)
MERDPEVMKLFHDDARAILPTLGGNSVHGAVTDFPYFLDGLKDDWTSLREPSKRVGTLPQGMKFDVQQGRDLQRFAMETGFPLFRVLVPGAYYITTMSPRLTHRFAMGLEKVGFEIRDVCIWKHQGGQVKAAEQTSRITSPDDEHLKTELFNWKTPQLRPMFETIILGQKPKEGTYIENWKKYGVGLVNMEGNPTTIFDFHKVRGEHLATKPVALFSRLITLVTREGQVVLDLCMGGGTTGVACFETKRHFIGIEIDDQYFNLAKRRLARLCNLDDDPDITIHDGRLLDNREDQYAQLSVETLAQSSADPDLTECFLRRTDKLALGRSHRPHLQTIVDLSAKQSYLDASFWEVDRGWSAKQKLLILSW